MNLLFNCSELNQLRENLFSERLKHCRTLLEFSDKPQAMSNGILFQQLHYQSLPTDWTALQREPKKATVSIWQRFWLNSFVMHWVWLLHKYQLHLLLSEQHTALQLTETGEVRNFIVNLSYTPIHQAITDEQKLQAYRQLKQFLAPIFNRLSQYSRLNEAVFWHNCANLIEFSLKELEADGVAIEPTYRQLFLEKKWDEYEWSPFYNVVEYSDFPALPFPQPVRMRKVCCHAHLADGIDYCGNCPKLKKIPKEELDKWIEKWA